MDEKTSPPPAPDADATSPSDEQAMQAAGNHPARFTRRQVLTIVGASAGGIAGAGFLAALINGDGPSADAGGTHDLGAHQPVTTTTAPVTTSTEPVSTLGGAPWSDPATWGGRVPGPGDVATIDKPILLDVDATVAGVQIERTGSLAFDPTQSLTLTTTGNVVVAGTLQAAPARSLITHRLVFDGVDESRFVGDHVMAPLDSDTGLWVVDSGTLDLHGTPKRAWTTLREAADQGDDTLSVDDATGWEVGDEIVVTPTVPTSKALGDRRFAEWHDRRTITVVDGRLVTLDKPLSHPHPAVAVRPGVTRLAEVLNLTRNVRVEGTERGRAHVMVLDANAAQKLSHVGLRHLGPQKSIDRGDEDRAVGVVGRYMLHFHMCGDGSRGSTVEGVVAYDGGNSAFVPHLSHGITFRDCVSHDQSESAYWWDQATRAIERDDELPPVPSNDIMYERCVAHLVRATEASKYGVSAFMLGAGRGNVARGCVAVGVLAGDESTAGYMWPAGSVDPDNAWTMEDCISHNNSSSAIYFWQNNVGPVLVDRFTSYHDQRGIKAGSYINVVSYRDCTIYADREAGVIVTAVPYRVAERPELTTRYENLYIDQAGLSEYAFLIDGHVVDPAQRTLVSGCHFQGATKAQVGFPEPGPYAQRYEFVDCTYDGNAFWLDDGLPDLVDIEVTDDVHGSILLRRADQEGEYRTEWNARVSPT